MFSQQSFKYVFVKFWLNATHHLLLIEYLVMLRFVENNFHV